MKRVEFELKINFHGGGGLEKLRIRLTSASTEVGVEVGAELGKNVGQKNCKK